MGQIQKEFWVNYIAENLYPDDSFINTGTDDSAFVEGIAVNKPQAGAGITGEIDRTVFPAAATERNDTNLRYFLRKIDTTPTFVQFAEEARREYALQSSVFNEHINSLNARSGKLTAHAWADGDQQFRTTGAADSVSGKKILTRQDIRKVAELFDRQNLPAGHKRYLLVPAEMYYQLFDDDALLRADIMGRTTLPNGVVGELFGFNIIKRPESPLYTNAATPSKRAWDAERAATDNLAVVAYANVSVCYAKGPVQIFTKENDPQFYGTVASTLMFHGANKNRSDNKGLAQIIQEDAA